MRIPLVDLKRQYETIRVDVLAALEEVMDAAAFVMGDPVAGFEKAFAGYCGTRHAVGVNSGTAALHLALLACGIGEGDEVITVPNTFIATASAIAYTDAKVVFVDVEPGTMNIDVDKLRRAVTGRTKAIVPVHLFGNPADMDGVMEVASREGVPVVEDAAQAHGALYRGRKVGSIGRAGCFSFYPGKNLGAYGDAGAIVTGDEKIASTVGMLRNHGRSEKFDHQVIGYNERLDAMQAAVLKVKLKHIDDWNESRRAVAGRYLSLLEDVHGIVPVEPLKETRPVYHLFAVRVEVGSRDELKSYLHARGVSAGIHYPMPLHLTPAFRHLGYARGDFPVSETATEKILSLPIFPEMTEEEIRYVADAVRMYAGSCRAGA
jgi:dTDP-4-amino-4,6-dideoxygalactose transaminase